MVAGLRADAGWLNAQQLLFLHRHSPLSSAFFRLRARGSAALLPATVDDQAQIVALLERFDGPANAALAGRWLRVRPEQTGVVHGPGGVAGFAMHLIVPSGSTMDHDDPVVRAVLKHANLRPGEQASIVRFMGGAQQGHRDPYAALAASTSASLVWCTRRLAVSYNLALATEFWEPFFDYLGFRRVLEVDSGGMCYVGYAHDWRRFPIDAWLELMNEREQSGGSGPPPESLLRPPPLAKDAFAAAVRAALDQFTHPERLAGHPLGPDVRERVEAAIEQLPDGARGEHARAVLRRTFVRPAPSREAAAEALGLPFSTYRRHLTKAIEQLTERLWAQELGTAAADATTSGK